MKICFVSKDLVLSWTILQLLLLVLTLQLPLTAFGKTENNIKSADFLSPKFELDPGSVANTLFYDIDFPKGHVAIKSLDAEIVDEAGNPVPLYETYLHHWVIVKYLHPKNVSTKSENVSWVRNSGLCQHETLMQQFGVGAETRKTNTQVPEPFGVEIGNPTKIPKGYEEKWFLNVHAIDVRGVEDRVGCLECRCDLYNATTDEDGKPLSPGYVGGMSCCTDGRKCRLKNAFLGPKRTLYLKYTITWTKWNKFIVPVNVYILDVTDTFKISDKSNGLISSQHQCHTEYQVEACGKKHKDGSGCIDVKKNRLQFQKGGYVIYAVSHLHRSGIGSTLYGQNGTVICSSKPTYGTGKEAGNEEGYVVGMSTCYPKPGSVKINDGEIVTMEINYSNTKMHSGVMGLFYIMLAEDLPSHHHHHRHHHHHLL
ncbi:hypothetical protein TanjilG_14392 [Lupinus angustifolius]|uniref:Stress up-regulated Nod 19 protein n=1 Tax=Lupinus angustifolius TaxID=3871 RepID=A0A1J7FUR6_LUPAN|nr:PREDICTED: uncharacterized protein LOC109334009 [Lupinus angustifolius]OIV91813.1 hypothetical protein TanjilG_14392 [Lupinus angustifolius]